jgi:leader peptidase (prepilin peptidase) / N-methyltransferase
MELTLIALLVGIILGWLMSLAADWLPQIAGKKTTPTDQRPALWLVARGQRKISLRLLAELGSGLFFVYAVQRYGLSTSGLIVAGAFTFLLLVTLIDLKYRLVLNIMTYPALVILLVVYVIWLPDGLLSALIGSAFALSAFLVTAWVMPNGVGGGDIKLAALIGLAFGFPGLIWALLIGAGSGAAAAIWLMLRGRRSGFAYAPYLCLGALIALIYNPFI